jgi:uncharacterized protein with gpF-like domain
LDDRTSEICSELDGKIFREADIDKYNPPLHYNCRSVIVPVFPEEIEDDETLEFTAEDVPVEREKGGFLKLG